jgi:prevent-host-death family protein
MPKDYSIAEARNQFAAIVHDLKTTPSIQLTRRGKLVAVLLSIEEYERLVAGRTGFWENYELFRKLVDLNAVDIDPDIVFADARDPAQGRELTW